MLGRLILLLLQIAVGWFGTNAIMDQIRFGEFRLFIFAIVAAIVVFLIGLLAAQVIKEVGTPSSTHAVLVGRHRADRRGADGRSGRSIVPDIPWRRVRADTRCSLSAPSSAT